MKGRLAYFKETRHGVSYIGFKAGDTVVRFPDLPGLTQDDVVPVLRRLFSLEYNEDSLVFKSPYETRTVSSLPELEGMEVEVSSPFPIDFIHPGPVPLRATKIMRLTDDSYLVISEPWYGWIDESYVQFSAGLWEFEAKIRKNTEPKSADDDEWGRYTTWLESQIDKFLSEVVHARIYVEYPAGPYTILERLSKFHPYPERFIYLGDSDADYSMADFAFNLREVDLSMVGDSRARSDQELYSR